MTYILTSEIVSPGIQHVILTSIAQLPGSCFTQIDLVRNVVVLRRSRQTATSTGPSVSRWWPCTAVATRSCVGCPVSAATRCQSATMATNSAVKKRSSSPTTHFVCSAPLKTVNPYVQSRLVHNSSLTGHFDCRQLNLQEGF